MPDASYQSLYRRFRPGRFSEVLGQDHVTKALRNAVGTDRVGHAYLFSGPRGTGKTSTARILAKALNCEAIQDGEPCCACSSCLAVAAGSSLDVHELDAASHNGVEAMRELVARAALATPGEWKVYIIDEVHMLSTAASNALLKTLEEPPGRVIFVLATTDPQKVLPTIRSRTQHFEFHLLGPDLLGDLVDRVVKDAGLDVGAEILPSVVRRARGSARDCLSALDQASAGGMVEDDAPLLNSLSEAIAQRDTTGALMALHSAVATGRDPLVFATELLEQMRHDFLATFAPDLVSGDGQMRDKPDPSGSGSRSNGRSTPVGLAALVRSMEMIGRAQVEMRAAVDPRVTLEVALVRLTRPEVDVSPEAIVERLERLERDGGSGRLVAGLPPPGPKPGGNLADRSSPPPVRQSGTKAPRPLPPGSAEQALKDRYGSSTRPTGAAGSGYPSRETLTKAWGDGILASLSTKARSRFKVGRFVPGEEGTATFALPNDVHLSYCEELRGEVQSALATHFGVAVEMVLVVDPESAKIADVLGVSRANGQASGSSVRTDDEILADPSQLLGEDDVNVRAAALIVEHFPGAVEVTGESSPLPATPARG